MQTTEKPQSEKIFISWLKPVKDINHPVKKLTGTSENHQKSSILLRNQKFLLEKWVEHIRIAIENLYG
jgi:hypothetical protein